MLKMHVAKGLAVIWLEGVVEDLVLTNCRSLYKDRGYLHIIQKSNILRWRCCPLHRCPTTELLSLVESNYQHLGWQSLGV